MGDEEDRKPSLPTLNFAAAAAGTMHSPDHPSGMATPPLHTLASVPFKWEEEPGKPRPCTDIVALPEPSKICLDLPPSRTANKINTKVPSPTTVLEGPYNVGRPKFSSFRFFREGHVSFDSSSSGDSPRSAVDVLLGKKSGRRKTRGFFGRILRFKITGNKGVDEGSFGFSPFSTAASYSDEKFTTVKR
ncbi:hypothetical protein CDL12_09993 [Handroanthus impetiginosus]|uniref:Uncharacterized protein n=1 Tax=Handroanthus impetiginosus TaxID=429701 RepID=A0A2G9HIK6_9LAMI|nr:hypothetical protein CDL12_09993 [Handroanthus impetiginosus]